MSRSSNLLPPTLQHVLPSTITTANTNLHFQTELEVKQLELITSAFLVSQKDFETIPGLCACSTPSQTFQSLKEQILVTTCFNTLKGCVLFFFQSRIPYFSSSTMHHIGILPYHRILSYIEDMHMHDYLASMVNPFKILLFSCVFFLGSKNNFLENISF